MPTSAKKPKDEAPEQSELEPLPRLAYTLKETAKILGISYISVYRLMKRGRLRCKQDIPGKILITARELDRFLAQDGKWAERKAA